MTTVYMGRRFGFNLKGRIESPKRS